MTHNILVTSNAIQQIDNAMFYYQNNVSKRVALKFIKDYQETFKEIKKVKYFKLLFEDFRGKPMKKFPYIVIYTVNEELKTIIIKAVFHTSQNPDKNPIE